MYQKQEFWGEISLVFLTNWAPFLLAFLIPNGFEELNMILNHSEHKSKPFPKSRLNINQNQIVQRTTHQFNKSHQTV